MVLAKLHKPILVEHKSTTKPKIFRLKKRTDKNKIIIMDLTEVEFDTQLEKLFEDSTLESETKNETVKIPKTKYKKIKKFDIDESLDNTPEEPGFNFEDEVQLILDEGHFKKYMTNDSSLESPNSLFLKDRVFQKFLMSEETYSEEVEDLLKIHLQFPSRDELISHKLKAWENLKILLNTLKENKGGKRLYDGLQFYRTAIIAKNGLKKYVERLPQIVAKIKKIIDLKVSEEVEQIIILDNILTTFEKRVLRLGDYLICTYKDFEKAHLTLALGIANSNCTWTPFSHESLTNILSPYEFMIYPLKEIISRYVGDASRPNYMYINKKDDWAWYYLESISESGTRIWKLDVWMDNLAIALDPVLDNCIALYENLYNHRFQDRNYRKFSDSLRGIEEDLRILIKNIEIMSNRKRCSAYLRKSFVKKYKYDLTDNDVLDRRTPDPYIFNLYENISQEEINKDWENICKRIYDNYVPAQ